MKKFIHTFRSLASVAYMMIFSMNSFAQERWEWQNPQPLGAEVVRVQIINENTVYFTGEAGVFYKTTDAGESWNVSSFSTLEYRSLPYFIDAQVGFIASNDGKIFKTIDAGDTWEMIYEDSDGFQYQAIDFYDKNNGVIAAQKSFTDSKLLKTSDGGETWKAFDSGVSDSADSAFYGGGLYGVNMISPDTIYVRGSNNKNKYSWFYRTFDGGDNWDAIELAVDGDSLIPSIFEAMDFVNDSTGFVAGSGATILKTVDRGATWKRVNSQTEGEKYYFNQIFFLDEQNGWIGGFDNDFSDYTPAPLFFTNDGGETWTEKDWVDEERFLSGIAYYNENLGYSIGSRNGGIYRTTDGGSSWEALLEESVRSNLFGIDATDDKHAWAVGADGTVLATSNSGEIWNAQSSNVNKSLRAVQFLDTQQGWAVGDSGTVVTTTNGGENWSKIELGYDENLRSIKMISPSKGWIVGDSSLVLKTIDGGDSWETVGLFPDDTLQLNSIFFINENKGWLGGQEGVIMHTTNGGETWNSQESNLLGFSINDFYFLDENNGWAVCSGGTSNVFGEVIKTEDGGTTWEQVPTNFQYAFYGVHFVNPLKGWITGLGFGGNNLLITNDGGGTWNTDTNIKTASTINSLDFIDENNGWTVGGGGAILKYSNSIPVVTDFSPKSGYEGVEVTISGEYFSNASAVTFNDVEALEFTILDDNTISAIVPKTTDGPIAVATSQGMAVSKEDFIIGITTGIEDGLKELIKIYPNPSNGIFTVELNGLSGQVAKGKVTLFNTLGRKINEKISPIENGTLHVDYSSSALTSGMYILNITIGNETTQRKLLVE